MDLELLLAEYSQEPKTEETVQKILGVQKEALSAQNATVFAKATVLLHDAYLFLQSIPEAIAVLQDAITTGLIEDQTTLLSLADKWVSLLLKTEDFRALEAALTFRERLLANNPPQLLVQKFYWAVCWEGLKKYREAITTLEAIGDGMSNNNLVSKYLKLAMLRLKTKEPALARAAFEHALIFDKTQKNEMFHLVESDLLFDEGDFSGSLKKFQEFFLKTKVKNRYLDRFIHINMAMGQYEEAWRFYVDYAAKLTGMTSKNYLHQFHEAGLLLAERMKKTEEAAAIKEKLLSIYDDQPVIHEAFDGVRRLFSLSQKKTVFERERDIYLESFRELSEVLDLKHIGFFRPLGSGEWTVYHPKKGLLLERKLRNADFDGTLLKPIIEERRDYSLFTREEMSGFSVFTIDPRAEAFEPAIVMAFAIPLEASMSGFLVAFLESETRFDFVNKMLFTLKAIIETRLGYFARINQAKEESRALSRLGSLEHRGYAKIIEGTVYLMNETAKEILAAKEVVFPYEKWQERFQTENPLYLDRLIRKECWKIPFRDFSDRIRELDLRVITEAFSIYLSFEDITEEVRRVGDLKEKAEKAASFPVYNMHRFLDVYQSIHSQTALLGVQVSQDVLFQNGYSFSEIQSLTRLGQSALQKAAKKQSTELYLGEDGTLFLLLSTTDKRVVERIFADFCAETVSLSHLSLPVGEWPVFRGAALNLLKGKTLDQNFDHLYAAMSRATGSEPLVFYDREMAARDQRIEAARIQLEPLLATGTIPLRYHQVGNLDTRKVEMYLVVLASDVLPYDSSDLREALMRMHSGTRMFWAMMKQLLKDWGEIGEQTRVETVCAVPVTEELLVDPGLGDELVRFLRRAKVPLTQLILVFHPTSPTLGTRWGEAINTLRNKGFRMGWEGILSRLRLDQADWMDDQDYVFVGRGDFCSLSPDSATLSWLSSPRKCVVTEVDSEEDARVIRSRNVPRIEGRVLPHSLSLEQLIQTVKNR